MELISQRVARGLPVKPKRKKRVASSTSNVSLAEGLASREQLSFVGTQDTTSAAVDWDKWGGRVTRTQAWAGDVRNALKDGNWKDPDHWKSINPFSTNRTSARGQHVETHSV